MIKHLIRTNLAGGVVVFSIREKKSIKVERSLWMELEADAYTAATIRKQEMNVSAQIIFSFSLPGPHPMK